MSRPSVIALLRAVFVGFWFLTGAYFFFCYDPFTWGQVIQFQLVPGTAAFASFHPALFWIAQGAALATLLPDRNERGGRAGLIIWSVGSVIAGVGLALHPLLTAAQNDTRSFQLAFLSFVPMLVLASLDAVVHAPKVKARTVVDQPSRIFVASLIAALVVWAVHAAIARGQVGPHLPDGALVRLLVQGLLRALCLAGAIASLLILLTGLVLRLTRSVLAESILLFIILAVAITVTFDRLLLPTVSFTGPEALVFATAVGVSLAAALWGSGLRMATSDSGLDLVLRPLSLGGGSIVRWLLPLVLLIAAVRVRSFDWNFVGAQTVVLCLWLATFASALVSLRLREPRNETGLGVAILTSLLFLGCWWQYSARALASVAGEPTTRYVAADAAFRLTIGGGQKQERADDTEFYDFLAKRTNLPATLNIKPIDVELSAAAAPTQVKPPHIFIFVVDSLRRDYLSPFNKAVTFTPQIEAFAHESDAFSNTFTHYGATGLSEPSIWVGGMMPHKQYITPFAPLNSLQKLLNRFDYRKYVSVDSILEVVTETDAKVAPLDVGIQNKDYDFCRSLSELSARVDSAPADERIFAYTQPQDVHISRITREGNSVPAGESYPGFHAPYASRVHRFDACFGAFIQHLKDKGLFDESIVILTADHGDSLGEEGRWGHAYTIYPEVMRIPLIVHLPPRLRANLNTDTKDWAFSTDITPTLYSLLGLPPTLGEPVFGVPLYQSAAVPTRHASPQLVVSSYGPVYGLLTDGGRHLYIADAVNFGDDAFDLSDTGSTRVTVAADERSDSQTQIQAAVEKLHSTYGVPQLP